MNLSECLDFLAKHDGTIQFFHPVGIVRMGDLYAKFYMEPDKQDAVQIGEFYLVPIIQGFKDNS